MINSYAIRPSAVLRSLTFFEQVGRRMMDFGFSGFFAQFEEKFGPRITKVVLGWLGFVACVAGFGLVWAAAIEPVLRYLEAPARALTLARLAGFAAAFAIGATLGNLITYPLIKRHPSAKRLAKIEKELLERSDEMEQTTASAEALAARAETLIAQMKTDQEDIERLLKVARLLVESQTEKKSGPGRRKAVRRTAKSDDGGGAA